MPFIPFKKGSNSHPAGTFGKPKGSPKPAQAGKGGAFDPNDSPGQDENGDGIYRQPVKSVKVKGNPALAGLKASKP